MSRFLRIILLFLREIRVVDFSCCVFFSSFFFFNCERRKGKGKGEMFFSNLFD